MANLGESKYKGDENIVLGLSFFALAVIIAFLIKDLVKDGLAERKLKAERKQK